jgi:hypothetical protein
MNKPAKNKQRMADIHNLPCSLCWKLGIRQTSLTQAHHKMSMGLGKKASDNLSMALCYNHHQGSNDAIHHMGSKAFERKFCSQDELIEITNKMLKNL